MLIPYRIRAIATQSSGLVAAIRWVLILQSFHLSLPLGMQWMSAALSQSKLGTEGVTKTFQRDKHSALSQRSCIYVKWTKPAFATVEFLIPNTPWISIAFLLKINFILVNLIKDLKKYTFLVEIQYSCWHPAISFRKKKMHFCKLFSFLFVE